MEMPAVTEDYRHKWVLGPALLLVNATRGLKEWDRVGVAPLGLTIRKGEVIELYQAAPRR